MQRYIARKFPNAIAKDNDVGLSIKSLCKDGRLKEALQALELMEYPGTQTYLDACACVFQGCIQTKSLPEGKYLHTQLVRNAWKTNTFMSNVLITLYIRCGCVGYACEIFNGMFTRNFFTWTILLSGYIQLGDGNGALKLFLQMQQEQIIPSQITLLTILKACASIPTFGMGKWVHASILKVRCDSDALISSALADMYAKCGKIEEAFQVFDTMAVRDVVSWNVIIAGCSQYGHGNVVLRLFWQMQEEGVKPDEVSFVSSLGGCSTSGAVEHGKMVHSKVLNSGYESNCFIANTLVDMYAKGGSIEYASQVFDRIHTRDVVTWNTIISGYSQIGEGRKAFDSFRDMQQEIEPNVITFISVLGGCASTESIEHGKLVHAYILEHSGCDFDVPVGNALVDMYAKCGNIEDAKWVFHALPVRDIASWGALITGYAQHEDEKEAFNVLHEMRLENLQPDKITFVGLLSACTSLSVLKLAHTDILKLGYEDDIMVHSSLVDMYGKCGSIDHSQHLFDIIPMRNLFTWTAIIAGLDRHGKSLQAIKLFEQMKFEGIKPDKVAYVSVLSACANTSALELAKSIHFEISRSRCELDVSIHWNLIEMYSKCGSIDNARAVFDMLPTRNIMSWGTMIASYSQHGKGKEALKLFEEMREEGIMPDDLTFTSILSACSHACLIEDGCYLFGLISKEHGIMPVILHYSCLIDLLSRAGWLDEAEELINAMPYEPNIEMWRSFLGSCRTHGRREISKHTIERILELMPQDSGAFVLLSNIYAFSKRWSDIMEKDLEVEETEFLYGT